MGKPLIVENPVPELSTIVEIAQKAGDIALRYFRSMKNTSWQKNDGSPLSEADLAVNEFIFHECQKRWINIGWQSEEVLSNEKDTGVSAFDSEYRWVVDPIDGTYGFLHGNAHWAVSLALVQGNRVIKGVVHCPVNAMTYYAQLGQGSWINQRRINICENQLVPSTLSLACPPTQFTLDMRNKLGKMYIHFLERNSIACRLTEVAVGQADASFSKRKCSVWDIAAAALIVEEAGGTVTTQSGKPIDFATSDPKIDGFIAAGSKLHSQLSNIINQL